MQVWEGGGSKGRINSSGLGCVGEVEEGGMEGGEGTVVYKMDPYLLCYACDKGK